MKDEGVGRRDFLRKVPLFGAGLALGLSALENAGEVPKARKLAGRGIEPEAFCNIGTQTCNLGEMTCNSGSTLAGCNSGSWACNAGR